MFSFRQTSEEAEGAIRSERWMGGFNDGSGSSFNSYYRERPGGFCSRSEVVAEEASEEELL